MNRLTVSAIALTLALAALIAVLTLVRIPVPSGVGGSDKLHHVIGFAALALPIACVRPRWSLHVAMILAIYGGVIELIQPHVGRARELADWMADLAGIGLGTAIGIGLNRAVTLGRARRRA